MDGKYLKRYSGISENADWINKNIQFCDHLINNLKMNTADWWKRNSVLSWIADENTMT